MIVSVETSVFGSNDEWRSSDIDQWVSAEETLVGGVDEQSDKEETDDVEQSNTPEDLLDGTRERLGRILGFSSCETDKFSARESEGGCDEDRADTFKAVLESSRVVPKASSPIFVVNSIAGTSTAYLRSRQQGMENGGSPTYQGSDRRP